MSEGERGTVLKNGSPFPLALPLSLPQTFTKVHAGRHSPARRRPPVTSPDGTKNKPDSKNCPASFFVQGLAGLRSGEDSQGHDALCLDNQSYWGDGGVGEWPQC